MNKNDKLDITALENVSEYWWKSLIYTVEVPAIQVTSYDDWAKEMESGYKFVNEGNWQNAEVSFVRASQISPTNSNSVAVFLSTIAKIFTGEILTKEQATSYHNVLIELTEEHTSVPLYHYYLAILYIISKDFDKALTRLKNAVYVDSNFGLGWAAIGLVTGLGRNFEQSHLACNKALELNKDIQNGLVQLCLFQADYQLKKLSDSRYPFDLNAFAKVSESEAIETLNLLPELHCGYQSEKEDSTKATLLIYADNNYFYEHVFPQILSIIESKQEALCVHVHVCNPDDNVEGKLISLDEISSDVAIKYTYEQLNVEEVSVPSVYYSCVRFCRLYEFLTYAEKPMLMIDADMIIRKPLDELIKKVTQVDVMLCQFEAEPLWQNIAAGVIGFNVTDKAIAYAGAVSTFILKHLYSENKKGRWFLDQVSLAVAHDQYLSSANIDYISHDYCDIEHNEKSIIWAVTNDKELQDKYNQYKTSLIEKFSADKVEPDGFNQVMQGKYGAIIYNAHDQFIGRSIAESGSWCDHEIELLKQFVTEGDVVVDAGANYGSHTVAFCKHVGESGRVYAFEPQRMVFQALAGSIALNSFSNAFIYHAALGSEADVINIPELDFNQAENFGGVSLVDTNQRSKSTAQQYNKVPLMTIDGLKLEKCTLIKIDVEGMEHDVITGAKETIQQFRPLLYVENHDDNNRLPVIELCHSLDYDMYWFGTELDPNIFCLPKETHYTINGLTKIVIG